ncbi:MAG: hypothetical protein CMF58_03055 [Lentimicrobiaceae bacterium]|jgi:hypothetical protein|nr:hypothetical protein [Lentimicrobiaceae bacterium]MDG2080909.1 hypothetical protein [Bacteroidales bacterium]|tara:strand:+ start:5844 stop:6086 length:243 start_codon:yes stop_codon:yes gene_type:complete
MDILEQIEQNKEVQDDLLSIYRANLERLKPLKRKWTDGDDVASKLDMIDYLEERGLDTKDLDIDKVWNSIYDYHSHIKSM